MPTPFMANGQPYQVPSIEGTSVALPLPPGALDPESAQGQARDALAGLDLGIPPEAQVGIFGENGQGFGEYLSGQAGNPQVVAALNTWGNAKIDVLVLVGDKFPQAAPYIMAARVFAPKLVDEINRAASEVGSVIERPVGAVAGGVTDVGLGFLSFDFDRVWRGLSRLWQPWRWFSGPSWEELGPEYLKAMQQMFASANFAVDEFYFKEGESRQFAEDALKKAGDGDISKVKDIFVMSTIRISPRARILAGPYLLALEGTFAPAKNWATNTWPVGVLEPGKSYYVDFRARKWWE